MKIMSVVGARPNFMKIAPIINAINRHNEKNRNDSTDTPVVIRHCLVHTGQHYDKMMSDAFFSDLNLPKPDIFLGIGSGSHAGQVANIMIKFESVLAEQKPDVLIVVGDVNSTLACALVASKITYPGGGRPVIAHIEAGLRSFDRSMPEEINRIVTDHISDMLFVTEESGMENLAIEGISENKIHFVGNTMIDTLFSCKEKASGSSILNRLGLRNESGDQSSSDTSTEAYALLTLHRPSNVDSKDTFTDIITGVKAVCRDMPVIFSTHPRTLKRIREFGMEHDFEINETVLPSGKPLRKKPNSKIQIINPLGYLDFLCLMSHAQIVLTDSGGIQEETTCLGVPCVTLRENTERPVTVTQGTNVLAGVRSADIVRAALRHSEREGANVLPPLWDGRAGGRIVKIFVTEMSANATERGVSTAWSKT